MANNCLVRKLMASVNNDNLLKLGECRAAIGTNGINIMSRTAQTISIVSGGTFDGGSTSLPLSANTQVTIAATAADTVISIPDKYSLAVLKGESGTKANLDSLHGAIKLYDLEVSSASGDIANLNGMNNEHLAGYTSIVIHDVKDVYGDISELFALYNKNNISLIGSSANPGKMEGTIRLSGQINNLKIAWAGAKINGDINNLSSVTNIKTLWIQGCDFGGTITGDTFTDLTRLTSILLNDLPNLDGNINNVIFPSSVTSVYIVNTACSGSRAVIAANNPNVTTWGLVGDGFTD